MQRTLKTNNSRFGLSQVLVLQGSLILQYLVLVVKFGIANVVSPLKLVHLIRSV